MSDRLNDIREIHARKLLERWTVSELDAMHYAVGLGEEWEKSDRRKELLEIENREIALLGDMIGDIRIE